MPSNEDLGKKENYKGCKLAESGNIDHAIEYFNQSISLNPKSSKTYNNIAKALIEKKEFEQARVNIMKAISLNSNQAKFYNTLGLIYVNTDKLDLAEKAFTNAINIDPDYVEALNNIACVYQSKFAYKEAIHIYKQIIKKKKDYIKAINNLGICYGESGSVEQAINYLRKVLLIREKQKINLKNNKLKDIEFKNKLISDAHWNLSLPLLLKGDYEEGFYHYEYRLTKHKPIRPHASPLSNMFRKLKLNNSDNIIIISEQGIGDTIQFMRYIFYLKQEGLNFLIAIQDKLHCIYRNTIINENIISINEANNYSNLEWISLLSIPKLIKRNHLDDIFNQSYIVAEPIKIERWKIKLESDNKPLIGINWHGNPGSEKGGSIGRSIPLEMFSLIKSPKYKFVSLQKGTGSDQMDNCSFKNYFINCQDIVSQTWDFSENCAIIECCDIVITSDTMIAHLSASMGKKTWLLLKYVPDWRWGLSGYSTHWYPSIRIFRQKKPGKWLSVFKQVEKDLKLNYS